MGRSLGAWHNPRFQSDLNRRMATWPSGRSGCGVGYPVSCEYRSSSPSTQRQVGVYFLADSLRFGAAVPSSRSYFPSPQYRTPLSPAASPRHRCIFHHGLLVAGGSYRARSGRQLRPPTGDLAGTCKPEPSSPGLAGASLCLCLDFGVEMGKFRQ